MTPVGGVALLSTFPVRVSSHLYGGDTCWLLAVLAMLGFAKGVPWLQEWGHNCDHSRRDKDVWPDLCSGCKTNWHARWLNLRHSQIWVACWHTWIHNADGSWPMYCLSCWAVWVQNVHSLGMAKLSRFCGLVGWWCLFYRPASYWIPVMGGVCCGDGGDEVFPSLYISGCPSVLGTEFTSSVASDVRYSALFWSSAVWLGWFSGYGAGGDLKLT